MHLSEKSGTLTGLREGRQPKSEVWGWGHREGARKQHARMLSKGLGGDVQIAIGRAAQMKPGKENFVVPVRVSGRDLSA